MAAEVERLTVVINATAEGMSAALEEAVQSLEGLEAAENRAANTARQAGRGIEDAARRAGHEVQQGTRQQAQGHREAGRAAQESQMTQSAALAAISAAAAKGFAVVVQAVNTGIDAYNRYTAALQGLDSIASGKGIAGGAVEEALKGLADQFLDTAGAAAALKNLLSRGYTLEQAVNTITRLKDAAAFGRQASLSLKDAVVSATEGIKNENSILVDNAGVTKNVAKMWAEYAQARGLVAANLTQAQKIEAEYAGIMQETALQAGDLAKMSDTLAGSQAEAGQKAEALARSFGEAMAPAVQAATEGVSGLLDALGGIVSAAPGVASGLTAAGGAILALGGTATAIKLIKSLSEAFGTLGISLGPIAAIGAAVGLAVGAFTAFSQASQAAAKAEAERIRANQEAAQSDRDRLSSLDELADRYAQLTDGRVLTGKEAEELVRIEQQLANAHGVTAQKTEDLVVKNQELAAAIRAAREEQARQALDSAAQVSNDARVAAMGQYWEAERGRLKQITEDLAHYQQLLANVNSGEGLKLGLSEEDLAASRQELQELIAELETEATQLRTDIFTPWLTAITQEARTQAQAMGVEISDATFQALQSGFVQQLSSLEDASLEGITKFIDQAFGGMIAAIQDAAQGVEAAVGNVEAAMAKMGQQHQAALKTVRDVSAWKTAKQAYDEAAKSGKSTAAAFETMKKAAAQAGIGLEDSADSIALASTQFEGLEKSIETAIEASETEIASLMEAMANAQDGMVLHGDVQISTADAAAMINQLRGQLAALRAAMGEAGIDPKTKGRGGGGGGGKGNAGPSAYQQAIKDMEHLQRVGKMTEEQQVSTLETIRRTVAMSAEEILDWEERLYDASEKVRQSRLRGAYDLIQYQQAMGQLDDGGTVSTLWDIRRAQWHAMTEEERRHWDTQYKTAVDGYYSKMYQEATALMQHQAAMGQLSEEAQLRQLQSIYQSYVLTAEQQREVEEQIYSLQESIRAKMLQDAYRDIDHRKALNQLTLDEELAHLERIRGAYQLNAEERMALEERIHNAGEALRRERENQLTQVGTGLQNALKKRYESMRDGELAYITQSQNAWKDWADESTRAIQAQIKSLDDLAQKEDQEKTDQEELRKIAKLRQDIQYEQDDYSRANLQKQLEQAIAAREARLRKQDVQDQKAALQEQAQAIKDKEKAEQEALKQQAQAVKDTYAQRMQAAAIQAEAERMLMQDSQQQIIDLIKSYAPEYDALGKTLGEKMLDGFLGQVGRIEEWMGQFNAAIQSAQQQMASASLQAADQFYGSRPAAQTVQVEQHNTFTVPVESPAETARRIRRANEELGMQLLRG